MSLLDATHLRPQQYKFVYPTHFGALTQLYAGTSAAGLDMNGKYLWPWAREGSMPGPTKDAKLGEEVWAWCEEQVKDL
jgi:retinol dehydrogenase-12